MKESSVNSAMAKRTYLLCWLVYSCSYFGRHNFSAAIAGIVTEGFFTKSQIGIVGTVFFIVYGLGQLVNGFLGDRLSPYKMIFIGTIFSAGANFLMCFAHSVFEMSIVWGVNGFAQSMLWSPIIFIVSNLFSDKNLVRAEMWISATIPAGTLAAYLSSTVIMKLLNWHYVFIAGAIVMFAVSVAWGINSIFAGKETHSISKPHISPSKGKQAPFFKVAVASGLAFMAMPVVLHAMLKDGVMTWVPTMISEEFHVTPSFSVMVTLVIPIINLFGAIIANKINSNGRISEMRNACIFFAFALLPLGALMFMDKLTPVISVILLGLITSSMFAINHIFLTLVPVCFAKFGRAATMAGLLDFTAYAGSAISSYGFGALSENIGWSKTITVWLLIAFAAMIFCLFAISHWERFKAKGEEI